MMRTKFQWAAVAVVALAGLIAMAAGVATTQPGANNPLVQMSAAYRSLKSLSLEGTISLQADIDGQKSSFHVDFTSSFAAPMKFHHEIKDDLIAAGTGDKVYLYMPGQNVYTVEDSPPDRGGFSSLSDNVRAVLRSQDLSLVFALSDQPSLELVSGATGVTQGEGEIDGKTMPAETASFTDKDITVILDPVTHLVRRVEIDESRGLTRRGATVKTALITIDYTRIVPNAALPDASFAYTPPATAQMQQAQVADANALVGKPAPHFRLARLDGGQVSDGSLKGSVYVLDFWASWCGPCIMSLPGTDELNKQGKPRGLKVFAVNLQEPADGVKDFIGRMGLTVPVLLDADGKTGAAYGAPPIPLVVIVGRDGVVRNIFVGAEQDQDIAAAVDAALNANAAPAGNQPPG